MTFLFPLFFGALPDGQGCQGLRGVSQALVLASLPVGALAPVAGRRDGAPVPVSKKNRKNFTSSVFCVFGCSVSIPIPPYQGAQVAPSFGQPAPALSLGMFGGAAPQFGFGFAQSQVPALQTLVARVWDTEIAAGEDASKQVFVPAGANVFVHDVDASISFLLYVKDNTFRAFLVSSDWGCPVGLVALDVRAVAAVPGSGLPDGCFSIVPKGAAPKYGYLYLPTGQLQVASRPANGTTATNAVSSFNAIWGGR